MADYTVSGPDRMAPGFPSDPFIVTLVLGFNPGGTLTITPHADVAGTFVPTTVGLTNVARSATFTFEPIASGSGTVSFTNGGGGANPAPIPFAAVLERPTRLDFWETTFEKFAPSAVEGVRYVADATLRRGVGGYWLDGMDHYDPELCWWNVEDYCINHGIALQDVGMSKRAASIRFRDRAVLSIGRPGWGSNGRGDDWDAREGAGVQQYHRYMGGVMRHYLQTGDPVDVIVASIMCNDAEYPTGASFSLVETHVGVQREFSFWLQACVDRAIMGLGEHASMDACARLLCFWIDLFTEPYATKYYGIALKPFMGGILGRALIHYWFRYRDATGPTLRVDTIAMIPAQLRKFSTYLGQSSGTGSPGEEPKLWYPPGDAGAPDWPHGAIAYRDLPNADPKFATIGPGLVISSVPDARHTIIGPGSLSATDDYYRFATVSIDGSGDAHTCVSYNGTTRAITVGNGYPFQFDVTTANTFTIRSPMFSSDESNGPAPDLNGMIAIIPAFCYWHSRHVEGNLGQSRPFRTQAYALINGNYQSWNQAYNIKQWNQSVFSMPEAIMLLERGDAATDWPLATSFDLLAPTIGLRAKYGRRSGVFRVRVPYGKRLAAPETITPGATGGGTLSTPPPVLNELDRIGGFTLQPAIGNVGGNVTISAIAETLPAPSDLLLGVEAAFAARDAGCKDYVVSGPRQSAVGVESGKFLVCLGAGTVTGTVRITPSATGGTWNPTFLDLDDDTRSKWSKFTPSGGGSRTVTWANNGGLTNPPGMPFQTAAYTPGAAVTSYSIAGPASGDVYEDSAPFTVSWGLGEVPYSDDDPGAYRFVPYADPDHHGMGEFFPPYFFLTDQTRSATFVYRPYAVGMQSVGFVDIADMNDPADASYEALAVGSAPQVTTYSLSGPATGPAMELSSQFTIALGSGAVDGPIVFTPSASAGSGVFIPEAVTLTDLVRSGTFSFLPFTEGERDISVSDDAGLTDPAAVTYTASAAIPGTSGGGPMPRILDRVVYVPGRGYRIIVPYEGP